MNADRFARVKAILAGAYELQGDERDAYLREACGDDAELHAEVRSLLSADEREGDTLGDAAASPSGILHALRENLGEGPEDVDVDLLPVPDYVGKYRILRLVARGGMGAVYEAEQEDPQRRVALKMLRPELITRTLLQRFRREAQILGRLQHAGIAQVYEAGTVLTAGVEQPYFAMEFVEGRPLTVFAAERQLDREELLDLFARVCDAVDHAHEKGVVHRDLKPDNILVTTEGRPKVLDFGVARATASDFDLATLETEAGQVIGTLAYMSPEQVRGDPDAVDGRSDVYSLGVLLYELLAGERPFDLARRSLTEALRIIGEREPTLLGRRETSCRGDLETIVGKALEKDRARRYPSAGALADDVRAHLRHQPILARPPSAVYQARKFVRRHRGLVTGAALGFAALLLGMLVALRFGLEEARQRAASERITYQTVLESSATQFLLNAPGIAAQRLATAPEALRGWEWEHLRARLDDAEWLAEVAVPLSTEEPRFEGGKSNTPAWFSAQGLAFTPDGERLVSFLDGRALGVWASATGELLARHDVGTELWVETLAVQGSRVALGSDDGRLLILDIDTGATVHAESVGGGVRALAWHPDGRQLAVGIQRPRVDGQPLHEVLVGPPGELRPVHGEPGSVRELVWLRDGARLAVARDMAAIGYMEAYKCITLDARSGEVLQRFGEDPRVASIAARADASELFVGTVFRSISRHVDAAQLAVQTAHGGHVEDLVIDLAVGDDVDLGASLDPLGWRLWRRSTGETLAAHVLPDESIHGSLALDPTGRFVAVARADALRVWRVGAPASRVLRGHERGVYWFDITPDGRTLVAYDFTGTTRVWDLITGEQLAHFAVPAFVPARPHHMIYTQVGLSADGERWMVRQGENFGVVDLVAGQALIARTRPSGLASGDAEAPDPATPTRLEDWGALGGVGASSQHFVVSPDARRMLDVRSGRMLEAGSFAPLFSFEAPGPRSGDPYALINSAACFSPDGARVLSAWRGSEARIHDAHDGRLLAELSGQHVGELYAVAWSPDGTRLATGGQDGLIMIWDAQDGSPLLRLDVGDSYVHALAWTPDGARLVSAGGDRAIHVWEASPRADFSAQALAARRARDAQRERVKALFAELGDPQRVADRLRADRALSDAERHAALRVTRELANAWWAGRDG